MPSATPAEAHAEWHRNAGSPMGTPGCPWDACHDDGPDEPEAAPEPTARPAHRIRCGACGYRHATIADVRACHARRREN